MAVENFIWDSKNQSVSWIYGGKLIKETFENAYFASVNNQENFVYVEAGKNYSQDQIYHLSFDGKRIFVLDKLEEFHLVTYYLKELFHKQCKMYMMGM